MYIVATLGVLRPQRNLAVELLQKLLRGQIRTRGKRDVVQARSFAELLDQAVRKYQNRAIETAQVLELLIELKRVIAQALGTEDTEAEVPEGQALGPEA